MMVEYYVLARRLGSQEPYEFVFSGERNGIGNALGVDSCAFSEKEAFEKSTYLKNKGYDVQLAKYSHEGGGLNLEDIRFRGVLEQFRRNH